MSVRIFDLEEWRILKAAQHFMLKAVESALADTTAIPSRETGISADQVDKLRFLRYEFMKLAISIESDKEIQPQAAAHFRRETYKIFSCLEAVLVTLLSGQPAKHHRFPALWELEYVFSSNKGREAPTLSALLVLPRQNLDSWFAILDNLTAFNKTAENLFWAPPLTSVPSFGDSLQDTLSAGLARKNEVETTLECLEEHFSKCPRQASDEHNILLQASSKKWKAEDAAKTNNSLFLSSCVHPSAWQEAECSHHDCSANSETSYIVTDICDSIAECLQYNDPLHLMTFNNMLYKKIDGTYAQEMDAAPSRTIQYLLDHQMLVPWSAGVESAPPLKIRDKRELTLNLAWCFVHLFDFKWMETGWSADRIYVLSSLETDPKPMVTVKPPYITCQQPNMEEPKPQTGLGKLFSGSVFLSLAKLLVEIEIGQSVSIEEKDKLGNPSLWLTIRKIIEDNQLSLACDDYIQAIDGCLVLHRNFDLLVRNKPELSPGKIIYEKIVAYLENDWKNYQRKSLKRRRNELGLDEPHSENKGSKKASFDVRVSSQAQAQNQRTSSAADIPPKRLQSRTKSLEVDYELERRSVASRGTYQETNRHKQAGLLTAFFLDSFIVETHSPPTCREEFEIAIICALGHEYTAVEDVIDQFWDDNGDNYGKLPGDPNDYTTGHIGPHNIVLVLLPEMGKANASSAANSIRLSYTRVKLALVVGICGAVPKNGEENIMLGDVIIGEKVVQHDFGRMYGDRFYRKSHQLGKANKEVSSITRKYKTPRSKKNLENHAAEILKDLQNKIATAGRQGEYDDPGYASDRLFKPDYRHRHTVSPTCICASCVKDTDPTCSAALVSTCEELQCDEKQMIHREQRSSTVNTPIIHIGAIASGDTVMKSGIHRDIIANELGVIAFEMEGCGVWEELPCLVIKGVCDYADSHKDKVWQRFAAASAASVAKAVIHRYIKTDKASGSSSRSSEFSWETNTNGLSFSSG
ncbi:unnamed protein product [Clonostachys rosea]|uniref:Nucleoside phosphorylase domain-containing protein n=1 Tax=Bionectria ochroleuca TaxID=29856 RepID=A0ABY6UDQ8_BIOOC|nr:unnamed protein product [Clonostachys rosea]